MRPASTSASTPTHGDVMFSRETVCSPVEEAGSKVIAFCLLESFAAMPEAWPHLALKFEGVEKCSSSSCW